MRSEISRIQRRVGVATFYVTHDQVEAMTMGDRVAVLHLGELQQVGTPQDLYERPDNMFVAAFIGSPAMNLFEAIISPTADEVKIGAQTLVLPESLRQSRPAVAGYRDRKVVVGIRPESLVDAALGAAPPPGSTVQADVELVEALGNELQVHFLIEASAAHSKLTEAATGAEELGGVPVLQMAGNKAEGVARVSPRSLLKAGDRAVFQVEVDRLHFFDPDTGLAIWN
jgi:multiple sugar transport system ATP-binding protein